MKIGQIMEMYKYTLIILALLSPWDGAYPTLGVYGFATSTESDSSVHDFTTALGINTSTPDVTSFTESDSTITDYNPEVSVTRSGDDVSTTDFTTDGATTSAFETTTAHVSSTTDSSATTVDLTTSTAPETTTTTTVQLTSTTIGSTTSSDRDTTTAARTTTTSSDRDTTTTDRTTMTASDRDTTSAARTTTTFSDRDTTTADRTTMTASDRDTTTTVRTTTTSSYQDTTTAARTTTTFSDRDTTTAGRTTTTASYQDTTTAARTTTTFSDRDTTTAGRTTTTASDRDTTTAVRTTMTSSYQDTTTTGRTSTTSSDRDTTTAGRTSTTSADRDTTTAARSIATSSDQDTTTAARITTTDLIPTSVYIPNTTQVEETVSTGTTTEQFTVSSTEDTTHMNQTESTFSETVPTLQTDDVSSTDFSTTTFPIETSTIAETSSDVTTSAIFTTNCLLISNTDVSAKDDVSNYVIMTLSIILGLQTIGIIVWCVWSRVKRTYKVVPSQKEPGMKNNLVTTATQTSIFFPETYNQRTLPPIDTHLEVVSERISKDIKLPDKLIFGNHLEIFSEKKAADDHEKTLPEEKCLFEADDKVAYSDLSRSNGAIPEDLPGSSDSEKDLSKTLSNKNVIVDSSLNQEGTEVWSVVSESIEIPYEDSLVNAFSGDKNKYEFAFESSESQTDSVSSDDGISNSSSGENQIRVEESENVKERLVIRTSHAVDNVKYPVGVLEKSSHPSKDGNDGQYSGGVYQRTRHTGQDGLEYSSVSRQLSREGAGCTGLENKKKTFQIKRWHDAEGDVEEVITLESESATSNKRSVSFEDTQEQEQNNVAEIDNNATLFGPGFRGLKYTETKYVDKSAKDVKRTRQRKRSLKLKPSQVTDTKFLTSPYLFQKQYNSIHGILPNQLFKAERYEERVRKNLRTSSARRKKRYKRNSSTKTEVISDETNPLINTEA